MRAPDARRRTHERSSRSRSLSFGTELREARRAARLADDVVQFWKRLNEKDNYRALQVGTLHRQLLRRENDSAEQVVSSVTRADRCAREVRRLELLEEVRQEEVRQEEVRQSGELRQVGQPNGGRPASPRGGERNRSELHRGISEVRRSVEAMRQREEDEIRDGMRRIGRRN